MLKGNCIIAQSGGPTSAINATLCGAYEMASQSTEIDKIYGGLNGIEGILQEKLVALSGILEKEENRRLLNATPASFLGSCRYKLPDFSEQSAPYERILEIFEQYNVRYFFYIGGNDSMDTVLKLHTYFQQVGYEAYVMGLPKTIDNDLMCIDHTPGFGSSAKFIAATVKEIVADSYVYDLPSVTVIEVMGRDTGWLAMSAKLAKNNRGQYICDLVYLPETVFSYEQFLSDLREIMARKQRVIVIISEGIRDANGAFIAEREPTSNDMFGHGQLGGAGKYLEARLKQDIGVKVRSVEMNVLQRCAAHFTSATDIRESVEIGRMGVLFALEGQSGKMVCHKRVKSGPYALEFYAEDIKNIANKVKQVPAAFINEAQNNVTELAYDYLFPLIQGEGPVYVEDGLPKHLCLDDFMNLN